MDFSSLLSSLQNSLGQSIPNLLLAVAFLVGGWIVAMVIAALVRKSLGLIKLNDRVRSGAGGTMDIEGGAAKGIYYLILLMALIAFFNALKLPLVSAPLQSMVDKVLSFLPNEFDVCG